MTLQKPLVDRLNTHPAGASVNTQDRTTAATPAPLSEASFSAESFRVITAAGETIRDLVQPLRPDPIALVTDLRFVSELLPSVLDQLEEHRAAARARLDFSTQFLAETLLVQFQGLAKEIEPTIDAIQNRQEIGSIPHTPTFWTAAKQVLESGIEDPQARAEAEYVIERLELAASYCAKTKSPLALLHQN